MFGYLKGRRWDMNNDRINIRILLYHFKVTMNWKIEITKNDYHRGYKHGYFQVYYFKPFKK